MAEVAEDHLKLPDNTKNDHLGATKEECVNQSSIFLTSINWNLIKEIHVQDIIYVKMEDDVIQKEHIPYEHQKRPFVVIDKNDSDRKFYGYYTTSNINTCLLSNQYKVILNKDDYSLKYHSLVFLKRKIELPFENVLRKVSRVSDPVFKEIIDKAELREKNKHASHSNKSIVETKNIIRDQEQLYVIYEHNSSFAYGFPITKVDHRPYFPNHPDYHRYIFLDQSLYFVDFDQPTTFSRSCFYKIVDHVDITTVFDLLKQRDHIKYLLKKQRQKQKVKK